MRDRSEAHNVSRGRGTGNGITAVLRALGSECHASRPRSLFLFPRFLLLVFLGIDLGGTAIKLGVCDSSGSVIDRRTIDTQVERGSDDAIARIAIAAHGLIEDTGALVACGIGAPGELDVQRRRLLRANHFPGWVNVALPERLGHHLGVHAILENDANCAAWGEFRAGAGRGTTSLACFTLGTGVGGGIIVGGELWIGVNGAAGALGHIAIDPNGPACRCGQRGCVEQYASATAVAGRYGRGSARDAFEAAARGDADAVAVIDWACDGLAAGVANVIHVVQPEVVVLAGGMAAAGDAVLDRVRSGVARRVRPAWLSAIRIEPGALGDDAGWIGAALRASTALGVHSRPTVDTEARRSDGRMRS
jgi:glucokinase